ncbi:hypothetical protein ACFQI7_37615 [Paenibacillus allorhizosphaerae]|uniref:DUF4871 domain-containing protein n=1 Tax=Paenibacillus allorhizosphaerae TaxID=2849866 RepID=A0ABM8VV56_9BACL|nr:hypothetical protein [Paenibacillus allorhizosphaerae]CAG7659218.1 hypothetical protein PAECIP111802_07485 [Paenibacillus allorhizosphaerae]
MRKSAIILLTSAVAIIIIVGITYFARESRPDVTKEPPIPVVTYNNKQISITMGTRVWRGVSDVFFMWEKIAEKATIVPPEGEIKIEFNYKPKPSKLYIAQVERDPSQENNWTSYGFQDPPLNGNTFKVPLEKNIYMVAIHAVWSTGENVEYIFAIEVK